MKKFFLLPAVFTSLLFAQQQLSHSLQAENILTRKSSGSDTLRILAILVQFAQDNDSRSSGNGTFDLSLPTKRIIDAPPHDSSYFADHFLFAENYFRKVSNGKQHLQTTVLGKVLTLTKRMSDYTPLSGNLSLVNMIQEAWLQADSVYAAFPFQNYDLFVVFHAGVGKDVDLRGTLGYDPTPYDIPSLYFSTAAFQKVLGNSFSGITLKNSSFKIPNTVVLPETENRTIPTATEDFLLKLSINGLLVANIASHLGLPDLFDTKTGRTAIGRFGLMDGQAIFSYGGISPPEPNAWEKSFLGWTKPIEVFGSNSYVLPAAGVHQTGEDTVYKIPISAKEYFLVENRFRDVKYDGQTYTMRWNGQTITKTIYDDKEINNTTIDSLYGVVIDSDEPDWNLPGYRDDKNSFQGGILIWHIDENIIDAKISSNGINADPLQRGVDLEEADGSQDLGQAYDFGQAGSGSEDGTLFDYWFKGNTAPSFTDEFSETTNPNSLSHSFAHSHITIKNFSVDSSIASFRAEVGTPDIQLLKVMRRKNLKFNNHDTPFAADLNSDGTREYIYTSGDSIYVLKNDFTPYFNNASGLFSPYGGKFQPMIVDSATNSTNVFLVGTDSNKQYIFSAFDGNNDGLADTVKTLASFPISTPSFSYKSSSSMNPLVRWGSENGTVYSYNLTSGILNTTTTDTAQVLGLVSDIIIKKDKLYNSTGTALLSFSSAPTSFVGFSVDPVSSTAKKIALRFTNNDIGVVDVQTKSINYFHTTAALGDLSVADVDNDGSVDILSGGNDGLYAFNQQGVLLEHFPLKTLDGGMVLGSSVVVKLYGTNETAILFGSTHGQLYAYTAKGKLLSGFPLQTGGMVSTPIVWGTKLAAASTDSSLYVWNVGTIFDSSKIRWGNILGNNYHANVLETLEPGIKKSSELLPKAFAYNWPNPTYGSTTHIRYYLGKPASVKIKIFNLAGELVDEINGSGNGGLDNEVTWNVFNIQSGIYFAEIKASGAGEEQSQIIKIAVVK